MRRESWRVELEPDVDQAFREIRDEEPRGIEAIDGFLRFVHRARPFHTGRASYLVIYRVDGDLVTCLGVRRVPSSAY